MVHGIITYTGVCIDKNKALEQVCRTIAQEQNIELDMEQIIQDNQTNPDFWKMVMQKGKGLVIEGNTRTEYTKYTLHDTH